MKITNTSESITGLPGGQASLADTPPTDPLPTNPGINPPVPPIPPVIPATEPGPQYPDPPPVAPAPPQEAKPR